VDAALSGDFETAYDEFLIEAERGLDLAQYNLSILYYSGQGVEKNPEEAFKWSYAAASQGHVAAMFNLASLYYNGFGVEKDSQSTVEWYGRAARSGHPEAAYRLALMNFEADLVPEDLIEAHAWANQAIYNEYKEARALLSRIEERLSPKDLSAAKRLFARWQISGVGQTDSGMD
jgi:TPR repeat protein|tara:strand:- start:562 stop:1086 length:525 start_codon:yes stop_codon:yes gene_type:complete